MSMHTKVLLVYHRKQQYVVYKTLLQHSITLKSVLSCNKVYYPLNNILKHHTTAYKYIMYYTAMDEYII